MLLLLISNPSEVLLLKLNFVCAFDVLGFLFTWFIIVATDVFSVDRDGRYLGVGMVVVVDYHTLISFLEIYFFSVGCITFVHGGELSCEVGHGFNSGTHCSFVPLLLLLDSAQSSTIISSLFNHLKNILMLIVFLVLHSLHTFVCVSHSTILFNLGWSQRPIHICP